MEVGPETAPEGSVADQPDAPVTVPPEGPTTTPRRTSNGNFSTRNRS